MSVLDAAKSGERLTALIALRDSLALSIDTCESSRDLAALSRQLTDVLKQIEDLVPDVKAGDPVDELSARRAARRAGSAKGKGRASR